MDLFKVQDHQKGVKMYKGRLKRLCSSRDGVHLGPEKLGHLTKRQYVYQNGSIDTSLDPPLLSVE
jgi:hypothetical protein